jgi:hypothetical protein
MSELHFDSPPTGNVDGDAALTELQRFAAGPPDVAVAAANDAGSFAQVDREQLARDIAEIERATAALRKGEPALESWTSPPMATLVKPRPLWLLIGVLWLSTALVAAGAVVAIATLVG